MMEKVIELLKEKPIIIPNLFYFHYKDLGLTEKEFLLFVYLLNQDTPFLNPKEISEKLGYSKEEVLNLVNGIMEKDLLSFSIQKEGNKREETLDFKEFYNKLAFYVINEKKEVEPSKNLYDQFEQEFGRTLSTMEYEIINGWLNGEFTEEMVLLALKEAVYNGVTNLRYIDKILYQWKKKGLKTKADVEKDKENFQSRKKETTKLFDYDWLNE